MSKSDISGIIASIMALCAIGLSVWSLVIDARNGRRIKQLEEMMDEWDRRRARR